MYTKSVFFTLILAFVSQFAACQAAPENLTPNQIGEKFIEAVNTTDPKIWTAVAETVYSKNSLSTIGVEKLAAHFKSLHDRFSPMEYHHSEHLKPQNPGRNHVLHIYARQKGAGMYSDFQFFLQPQPPYLIDQMIFVAEVAEPISLPNGAIEQPQTLAWLDSYIRKLIAENDLSGSILIEKNGKTLFEKYWGAADTAGRVIDRSTLFGLASGSKMFTALAILQLEEQGKLKVTDRLTKYFPDFPNKAWAEKTTLHHLLSHTSGIGEYWTSENEPLMMTFTDWHQFLPLIYKEGFKLEPGTESAYSNSNFMLLGKVIEQAGGEDFYTYVQKNIIQKAGMTASGYFDQADPNLPVAQPFARKDGGGWKSARVVKKGKGSPAGGCISNAAEMAVFCKALKNNELVAPATLQKMTTDHNRGMRDAQPYGYGFILEQHEQEFSFGHGGTAGGVNFEFRYFPGMDVLLVVFCNQNNGAYDDLKRNTLKLISGAR